MCIKKISCKPMLFQKKNPAKDVAGKKISSTLKIWSPPHQKSNGPSLTEQFCDYRRQRTLFWV